MPIDDSLPVDFAPSCGAAMIRAEMRSKDRIIDGLRRRLDDAEFTMRCDADLIRALQQELATRAQRIADLERKSSIATAA